MIEVDKYLAEGYLAEERLCICWVLNTRELLVKLPERKCKAWANDLKKLIRRKGIS